MIKLLDCTLRDGGYINNWNFGKNNIKYIIDNLVLANMDFVELGYLNSKKECTDDSTIFSSINNKKIDNDKKLCMINYGDFNIDDLVNYSNETIVSGIRYAFHKENMNDVEDDCIKIKNKGYKLFVQPMVTKRYDKNEFVKLIEMVNRIEPYAFYLVDSFGSMTKNDIQKYIDIINEKLNKNIAVGFHAHNNLQLAFSNVTYFVEKLHDDRDLIVDSSVFGMGRGAGNLPSELIADFLNKNYDKNYNIIPMLEISDNIISKIFEKKKWGYSLPYYLSAKNNCHPNYAISFMERNTLTAKDINNLIGMIEENRKVKFNKEYADEIYDKYNNYIIDDNSSIENLIETIDNREVLLIGPGKSIVEYKEKIENILSNNNIFSISVNNNLNFKTDAIFFSNRKRYDEQKEKVDVEKIMLTSNIKQLPSKNELIFNYNSYLAYSEEIKDTALPMIVNILKKSKVSKIYLAGFDGFTLNPDDNFYDKNVEYVFEQQYIDKLNSVIRHFIDAQKEFIEIKTITPSINIDEGE